MKSNSPPTPATPLLGSGSTAHTVYAATMSSTQAPITAPVPSTSGTPPPTTHPDSYFPPSVPTDSAPVADPKSRRARGKARAADGGELDDAGTLATKKKQDPWWKVVHVLENKGSVARDHLANERTFLAWLRTSLALASIGIAITQLFRLTTVQDTPASMLYKLSSKLDSTTTTVPTDVQADLRTLLIAFGDRLDSLEKAGTLAQNNDPAKYRRLGKPVGGVFIMLALLFLILGSRRYFRIQHALMKEPQSKFPPSRRSVAVSSVCVAGIVIASFAAILAR